MPALLCVGKQEIHRWKYDDLSLDAFSLEGYG